MSELSLAALRAAYAEGRTSPRRLIGGLLQRAAALNPEYHLFITLLGAEQLEPYLAALDAAGAQALPLYGVPFAIKDNIDLVGVPSTAACPDYAYLPQRSATVVGRLIALGAVPIGKTNLDQFATGLNGTRSPYGACRNSVRPEFPSGGSSSGSALAVALGVSSFALGTDTAGSGRVPAALNGLIGLKPSCGLLSTRGVVPACRTLDCVSVFTGSAADASELLDLLAATDAEDAYSRANPAWNAKTAFGTPAPFRFGVPRAQDLIWCGCEESPKLFAQAVESLAAIGGTPVEIDFSPFLEAARLLYEGPWVAERFAAVGAFIRQRPDAVLPVIREIIGNGDAPNAVALFRAQYRLRALKAQCDAAMAGLDAVMTPALPRPVSLAELHAEPILRNSELGTYTNFMNLLDFAAVAVPAGTMKNGLPWGVTLFGRVFTDQYLLSLAGALRGEPLPKTAAANDRARVVVCGAHLQGQPLNGQLTQRGGRLLEATHTAPRYKCYALAGGPPFRPGLIRVDEGGGAIEVEVWEMPSAELGSFLAGIGAPLGLGKLDLADGRWEIGFICEPCGADGAEDITTLGGWRAYLATRA